MAAAASITLILLLAAMNSVAIVFDNISEEAELMSEKLAARSQTPPRS